MKIHLQGIPPAKKNSKRWIIRGGRKYLVSSAQHEAWKQEAFVQLFRDQIPKLKIDTPHAIHFTFMFDSRKQRDIDNIITTVLDMLKEYGVLSDDRWTILPAGSWNVAGIDKSHPYVEVTIEPISENAINF